MKKIVIMAILVLAHCLPLAAFAQMSNTPTPDFLQLAPDAGLADATDPRVPGVVEGTGTQFAVTDSEYLNITLDSLEAITLLLSSAPEIVTMHLEQSPDRASTQITLGGFLPSTTYYKYEDNYHNKQEFTTDNAGAYTYQQDLSVAHFVYIQPRKSTKFLSDDASGGDCASIGLWDAANKTCTLTMDLNETVQVDSDNVTLDGNGHTITGTGTGFGVYLPGRSGVTVKGINVKNFGGGIYLRSSTSCTISNNRASFNTAGPYYGGGIHLDYSSNSIVIGNTSAGNNNGGISLSYSAGNMVTGNTSTGNRSGYITGYTSANTFSENIAEGNSGTGFALGYKPNTQGVLQDLFENNIARNNTIGIHLSGKYNTLRANTVSGNDIGINFNLASYNTLRDNIVQENRTHDITFRWFTLSGGFGMMLGLSNECTNIIENTTGSGGRPIKYFSSAVDLRNEVLSGLILCNADNSTISDVTIVGSDMLNNSGLLLVGTDNSILRNITSSDNKTGIYLSASSNNVIENSVVNANEDGIRLSNSSSNNTIRNNRVNNNTRTGLFVHHGNQNLTVTENIFANSLVGIALETSNSSVTNNTVRTCTHALSLNMSRDNLIYNNSFIDYTAPAVLTASSGNVFNLDRPVGGNYWSNFDSTGEGCSDLDHDGFCDALYNLGGAGDNLPWTSQDAWNVPQDSTAPATTITIVGLSGSNGWYRSDVQVTLTATDNEGGSGVKEIRYTIDGAETTVSGSESLITISTEGTHAVTYGATDNAGNLEIAHPFVATIDKTPPAIAINGVTHGAVYTLEAVPVAGYTVADNLSGMAGQSTTLTGGDANNVGVYTYTVNATDNAGNAASASAMYSVVYAFGGFLAPVSLDRPFRLGSTIPVKFQLTDASGAYISTATATITVQQFSTDQPAGDPIDATSTSGADTGNTFRYSAVDNQYIYNLGTDGLSEGTWQIRATLDDGTVNTAFISLKAN